MVELFVRDIPKAFNIEENQLNITMVKELLNTLRANNLLTVKKQKFVFEEDVFASIWNIFDDALKIFDPNYNRQEDFRNFFELILKGLYNKETLNFYALFCPGYTRYGYKSHLGDTTKSKLKRLYDIKNFFAKHNIKCDIIASYSDAFLENTNAELEPEWEKQMIYNRELFHIEGEKYLPKEKVQNVTDLSIFQGEESISGYIDHEEVSKVNPRTYYAFKKSNEKFYTQLEFTKEEMEIRNDRLITMYRILSNYLNTIDNMIFLPMENMYERENIFSENGTCTMYLRLKGDSNEQ